MQACVDWVLIIFGTQVIKKKRPARPVFPDYLSVSYGYGKTEREALQDLINYKTIVIKPVDKDSAKVIWDKEDYLKDSQDYLNDNIVYGEVTGDPLQTLEQKIKIVK